MEEAKRYDRSQRKHIQVPMPQIVKIYNKFMGGVNKMGMCALYKREVRSRKWYIYIFIHTNNCFGKQLVPISEKY